MVYETLGSISGMERVNESADGLMRLSGVFGVCGVKNGNNRIYEKANYGKMVNALSEAIATDGVAGELEHPASMNINLNNVSHKIESIEMHEDGTVTGTVVLLNTAKGRDAQAMVEGGLPLFISSRGAGSIDEAGHVTLTTIKTYDLVGTPGFSQAKLTLKKGQKFESLNESIEDGPISWAIIEESEDEPKNEPKEEPKQEEPKQEPKNEPKKEEPKQNDNNNNNNTTVSMEDIKKSIDALTERITQLESQLHIAQEALEEAKQPFNYNGVQRWLTEEFAPEFKNEAIAEAQDNMEAWINECFAPTMDSYIQEHLSTEMETKFKKFVNEEFATKVQEWVNEHALTEFKKNICEELGTKIEQWITTEYSTVNEEWMKSEVLPGIQNWINEEYTNSVQNWIKEEYTPATGEWVTNEVIPNVEKWMTESFAPQIQNWITECFAPENTKQITESINANLSEYMESQKGDKYTSIDRALAALESKAAELNASQAQQLIAESAKQDKYSDSYVVVNMPAQYRPMWESISDERKDEVIASARMYDFTKPNALESFWANQNFNATLIVAQQNNVQKPATVFESVAAMMHRLRH